VKENATIKSFSRISLDILILISKICPNSAQSLVRRLDTWTWTIGCDVMRRYRVNRVKLARTHQRWIRQQWNSVLFSDDSRLSIYRSDVYRRRKKEKNVMPTAGYLNEIVLGVEFCLCLCRHCSWLLH
jgi:hypothetical protein